MGDKLHEKKGLPPPGIVNRNSVWLSFMGWCSAILQNAIVRRPAIKSGVHRQVLFSSIGWFLGYYVTKNENYTYARFDRDMKEYIRLHPLEFAAKEKRTFAEIVEPFRPVR